MVNMCALRDAINAPGYKITFIAKRLGISYQALLNKINCVREFKASEIRALSLLLWCLRPLLEGLQGWC